MIPQITTSIPSVFHTHLWLRTPTHTNFLLTTFIDHTMIKREGTTSNPPSSILFIGLIPFEWDESNLKAVVCATGNVLDIRLGFDHVGKNKGFAFVEYESPQQAQRAMELLSQINITQPGTRITKKFRIELSKEGFRTGNSDSKSVIPFNAARLPPGVQFPPEVIRNYPQLQQGPGGQTPQPPTSANGTYNSPQPTSAPNGQPTIPDEYMQAGSVLPRVGELPFAKPDKINENLAAIPPPELIQLIANVKLMLSTSNASRAAEVFQISPGLATATAQALLLMGFVNEEVILEAMKADTGTPQPQMGTQQPLQQQYNQGFGQQGQNFQQGQSYQNIQGQNFQNYNQGYQQPQQQQQQQQQQQYGQHQQQYGQQQQQYGQGYGDQYGRGRGFQQSPPAQAPPLQSKWPHLSLSTQMKLSNVAPDQAELIVQVLSLTPDQINALPPDRQQMVAGIRQQYL